jgi:hypothetical protein
MVELAERTCSCTKNPRPSAESSCVSLYLLWVRDWESIKPSIGKSNTVVANAWDIYVINIINLSFLSEIFSRQGIYAFEMGMLKKG